MNILEFIPVGKENAVSRHLLCQTIKLSDRKMRKLIEEAREKGEIIINLQDGSGYYRPSDDDIDEIEAQYKINNSRAMSILVQQKPMRKVLKEAGKL